jgi:hypothetical protein
MEKHRKSNQHDLDGERTPSSDAAPNHRAQPCGLGWPPEGAPPSNTAPPNCISGESTRILRCDVDSLYLSYPGDLAEDWDQKLRSLKLLAQSPDLSEAAQAQVTIGEHVFEVRDRGSRRFAYVLEDGWYRLELSAAQSLALPLAYVQIASELLTAHGVENAEKSLRYIVNTLGHVTEAPNISRVDLCVDFLTDTPLNDIKEHAWVTRAHQISKHTVQGRFSGWSIGSGGKLSARLYDKTLELQKSHKDYLKPLWTAAGWQEGQTVWRLEFQYRRDVLKELGIRKIPDLLNNLAGLWRYAIEQWLRLTLPSSSDATQTRWPLHPLWLALAGANWHETVTPALTRARKTRLPSDESLFINGLGFITSFMAREGITDMGEGFGEFLHHAHQYHDHKGQHYGKRFQDYVDAKVLVKAKKYNTLRNTNDDEAEHKARAEAYQKAKDGE